MSKTTWLNRLDKETRQRLELGRACNPSLDVWTKSAHDMLKIAAIAGFDVPLLMRICFRRTKNSKAARISAATVERAMGDMHHALKEIEHEN